MERVIAISSLVGGLVLIGVTFLAWLADSVGGAGFWYNFRRLMFHAILPVLSALIFAGAIIYLFATALYGSWTFWR